MPYVRIVKFSGRAPIKAPDTETGAVSTQVALEYAKGRAASVAAL